MVAVNAVSDGKWKGCRTVKKAPEKQLPIPELPLVKYAQVKNRANKGHYPCKSKLGLKLNPGIVNFKKPDYPLCVCFTGINVADDGLISIH